MKMKTTLTILLTFIVSVSMAQSKFHLRVEGWYSYDRMVYAIYFTPDNWNTRYNINTCENGDIGAAVLTKTEAIDLAKKLNSYNRCVQYNNSINSVYLKTRKGKPETIKIY